MLKMLKMRMMRMMIWNKSSMNCMYINTFFLYKCNLKGAIVRENALLLMKPIKVVDECREFE